MKRKTKCPIHSARYLLPRNTQYGTRYYCPVGGCTVVSWNGSKPADLGTRQARMQAHEVFDKIWKSGTMKRVTAYKKLSHFLNLPFPKTHISQFDYERCMKTIEFAQGIMDNERSK